MNRLLLPLLSISLTLPALAGSDEVTVVPAHVFSGAPQHGVHVATSGDLALLGGPSGELTEVLVHERVHSGWSLVDSLQPDAWITPTSFGEAVEIDGSTAVVGGRGTVPGVGPCVVAWIFREGGGAWFLEGHAWSADHPSSGDHRIRIAVDGDRLAITAQGSTEAAIWTRSTETWSHEATFSSDMTGKALDLDGDRFLMQDVAMLRIFRRVGSGWQIEQTLSAGIDADLCGDRLVIGGIQWSQAHVYEFVLDEWSFVQDVTVAAGTTVELDGERLVASNWPATGATLFQHDGSEFVPVGTLDGGSDAASPNIGLDLSGDTVILGGSVATGHRIGESLGTSYCQAGVNSMGLQAEVLAIGSAVAAEDGFELAIRNAVPNAFAIPLFGHAAASLPLGSGTLCVDGPIRLSAIQMDGGGSSYQWVDLTSGPGWQHIGAQVPVEVFFQAWYRDGSASNLTDGVTLTFQ